MDGVESGEASREILVRAVARLLESRPDLVLTPGQMVAFEMGVRLGQVSTLEWLREHGAGDR